jgi:hypothetical protein
VTYVIGALLVAIAIQAVAIVALLIKRTRRTLAERALHDTDERSRLMVDRVPVIDFEEVKG